MRVAGRITVFGEAMGGLMDLATVSVPSRQALVSGPDAECWVGKTTYDPARDHVGRTLVKLGLIADLEGSVTGDLPIESGLASSTALGLLHLGRWGGGDVVDAIAKTDLATNGFEPTGCDSAAIRAQEPGAFGLAGWAPLAFALPSGSHLLRPERERASDKLAATLAIRHRRSALEPMIRSMVTTIESSGELDLDALLGYAKVLSAAGVYSRSQAIVIDGLLRRGIVAKGVGALYDRAIVVLADESIWDGTPPMEMFHQ